MSGANAGIKLYPYLLKHGEVKSAPEISKELGFAVSTVKIHARRIGIRLKQGIIGTPKKKEVQERIEWIRANGHSHTIQQMAERFNLTYNGMKKCVEENDLPFKYSRKPLSESRNSEDLETAEFFNPDTMLAY